MVPRKLTFIEQEDGHVVRWRNQRGTEYVDDRPVFHGGPGSTLEMRIISHPELLGITHAIGFVGDTLPFAPEWGYFWPIVRHSAEFDECWDGRIIVLSRPAGTKPLGLAGSHYELRSTISSRKLPGEVTDTAYNADLARAPDESRAVALATGTNPAVTDDDVVLCYRVILGREPDLTEAIRRRAAAVQDFRSLVLTFVGSPEYRQRPGVPLIPPPDKTDTDPAITDDDVVWCYRFFLGREAKSAQAVRTHLASVQDFRSLVLKFVNSPEHRQKQVARPAAPPDRPAVPAERDLSGVPGAAKPLPADRLFAGESPASVVVTSGGRPDLLDRTLSSFFRYNTFPIRELIIVEYGDAGQHQSLVQKYQRYPVKWLEGAGAGETAAIDIAYAAVESEFILHCEDDWEFTGPGFIEKSLSVLRHKDEVLQVWLRALNDTDGHPLLDNVFFAEDIPYRVLRDDNAGGGERPRLGVSFSPGLSRRRDYRLIDTLAAAQFHQNRGFLTAILGDNEGRGYVKRVDAADLKNR